MPAEVCVRNGDVKVGETQWMDAAKHQKRFLNIYFSYISQPILYYHFGGQH